MRKLSKFDHTLIVLLLICLVCSIAVYFYQYYPAHVRKVCEVQAKDASESFDVMYPYEYVGCLKHHGLYVPDVPL